MELYHATTKTYQIGKTYNAKDYKDYSHFYNRLSSEGKEVVDKLDSFRPEGIPARKTSMFFFSNLDYCSYFAHNEYSNVPIRVYKVNVPDAKGGFPMCLVQTIFKQIISIKDEVIAAMIDEYWNPKDDWNFMEYIGQQMTIIEECEVTKKHIVANMHYNIDCEFANTKQYLKNHQSHIEAHE